VGSGVLVYVLGDDDPISSQLAGQSPVEDSIYHRYEQAHEKA
jgi:hypothetical protein